ncbi:MAG TPA: prolyl oligopeptidase family serine peptidase [Tepidisphaeraceae bacterium]|nr:prolyl oligopeptidase family serine peptidase [Tepidisphaeraceae bacterium]
MNVSLLARCLVLGVASVLAARAQAVPDLSKSTTGSVSDGSGNTMPYRLFRPAGYDSGAKYPLVLFLHGAGERGNNNTSQVNSHIDGLVNATQSATYASYLLAPQVATGNQFVNVPFQPGSYSTPVAQSTSMALTLQALDLILQDPSVDKNRVYVTGLSMGGYGTFDILVRRPNLFAAAAPLSGGGSTSQAGLIDHVPLWAFHGSADTTVFPSGSRDMIAALEAAGGDPRYTEFVGAGHNIWSGVYTDTTPGGQFYPWMFSQALPEPGAVGVIVGALVLGMRRRGRR